MEHINWEALLKELLYNPKNPLLFNCGFFVYFFVFFILLYYLFRKQYSLRAYLLSFFSLYFFYKASGHFVILVLISAVADYMLSNLIYRQSNAFRKRSLLILSIVLNLGFLFYFKYANFFISISNEWFGGSYPMLDILLPIGISFYTFENISYTVDVYKGEIVPEKKFINYLLFLSFFPKLVMGPIVRAKDFIPQLRIPFEVSPTYFSRGFFLIMSGLVKKLIISDYITLNFVNYIFDNPSLHTGLESLLAVYGYAIVIYCDFSGYSEIAIGIALWLGIHIPDNFRSPYKSLSIQDFWRRWHISLSSWLRDYLYIPLGGNKKGTVRTYQHLFLTMLLGGFWHGASWNFILWGALHGSFLAFHKFLTSRAFYVRLKWTQSSIFSIVSLLLTFHFVCFCWIYFRAENISSAHLIIHQILHNFTFTGSELFFVNYQKVLGMMLLGYILHAMPDRWSDWIIEKLTPASIWLYILVFVLFLMLYSLVKNAESVMPIYLQF